MIAIEDNVLAFINSSRQSDGRKKTSWKTEEKWVTED